MKGGVSARAEHETRCVIEGREACVQRSQRLPGHCHELDVLMLLVQRDLNMLQIGGVVT